MSSSVLSQASAFNPGSDLWIVPDLEKSQWTAKLDWHLNFQICKSTRHLPKELPAYLKEVIQQTELSLSTPEVDKDPLMISSSSLLPNKWVVIIPWQNDLNLWCEKLFKVWKDLNQPSLRIFLPPGQSAGLLQGALPDHGGPEDFTVVLD